jgi:hypothetical protein
VFRDDVEDDVQSRPVEPWTAPWCRRVRRSCPALRRNAAPPSSEYGQVEEPVRPDDLDAEEAGLPLVIGVGQGIDDEFGQDLGEGAGIALDDQFHRRTPPRPCGWSLELGAQAEEYLRNILADLKLLRFSEIWSAATI